MIEVLKQALEALENSQRFVEASANAKMLHGWGEQLDTAEEAITSLRQAIAELESQDKGYCQSCDDALCTAKKGCVALSNPPQRKPLTDEEIFKVHKQVDSMQYLTFARAIEAAHGIKE